MRRSMPGLLYGWSTCQSGSFDSSFDGGYGFYMVHYQNNEKETNADANKVKQFITQFGSISTGYPWYIAYCKYPDGTIYARYGSLYSRKNYNISEEDAKTSNILKEAVKTNGEAIKYLYGSRDDDDDDDGGGDWGDGGGSGLDGDDGGESSYDDYYDRNDPGSKNAKGMFGIGHDCVIITKDNKIVRYSERTGTFIIEGDYNPTKNIKTAKIK